VYIETRYYRRYAFLPVQGDFVMPKVEIDGERCKGCGLCVDACPEDVLALGEQINLSGYHYAVVVNPESCSGCAQGAEMCPDLAITVWR
jgi:2-oxoglutarate ferredoxin oxidoreductase subunit delta